MRQFRTYGSVGAPGGRPPGATWSNSALLTPLYRQANSPAGRRACRSTTWDISTASTRSIDHLVSNWKGLELAGDAYRGMGIPQCILSGETAAERTAVYLGSR